MMIYFGTRSLQASTSRSQRLKKMSLLPNILILFSVMLLLSLHSHDHTVSSFSSRTYNNDVVLPRSGNCFQQRRHAFGASSCRTTTHWMSNIDENCSDSNRERNGKINDESGPPKASASTLKEEAQILKHRANVLRREISEEIASRSTTTTPITALTTNADSDTPSMPSLSRSSPWDIVRSTRSTSSSRSKGDGEVVDQEELEGEEYRLYVDIGREDGTWMDPRWGASGKRIEFTIDIKLLSSSSSSSDRSAADGEKTSDNQCDESLKRFEDAMVKDNTMGQSSKIYAIDTARYARLRDGFDRMECTKGAYRIDQSPDGRYTIRLVLDVEGTTKADQQYTYGDVSIPRGYLYFSLPCFGGNISQLSSKEGPVTVRQVGWHTGWRRQESRIVGVFRATPLADAKRKDSY